MPWVIIIIYIIAKIVYSSGKNKAIEFYLKEKESDMQAETNKLNDELVNFQKKTRLNQFEQLNM
jgi:hypothetical protein